MKISLQCILNITNSSSNNKCNKCKFRQQSIKLRIKMSKINKLMLKMTINKIKSQVSMNQMMNMYSKMRVKMDWTKIKNFKSSTNCLSSLRTKKHRNLWQGLLVGKSKNPKKKLHILRETMITISGTISI